MQNKKNKAKKTTVTVVRWADSYGALSGWVSLDEMETPEYLECLSVGVKIFEDKKVVALAPNYAKATTYTPNQGNGIMIIPKSCIISVTSFSC